MKKRTWTAITAIVVLLVAAGLQADIYYDGVVGDVPDGATFTSTAAGKDNGATDAALETSRFFDGDNEVIYQTAIYTTTSGTYFVDDGYWEMDLQEAFAVDQIVISCLDDSYGHQGVLAEYSLDGANWTEIGQTASVESWKVEGDQIDTFDLNETLARYIRLTPQKTWRNDDSHMNINGFDVHLVPEPASVALLSLGGIAAFVRKRK